MRSQSLRVKKNDMEVELADKSSKVFDPSTKKFPPIVISTESAAFAELERLSELLNKNVDWSDQVKAIRRGISLVNGGILNYQRITDNINMLSKGLTEAFHNQRSKLVKWSCKFLCQLATELGEGFAKMGDILSDLSKRTNNGTSVISESCKVTMLIIIKNCSSRFILLSIFNLASSRNFENRQIASEGFKLIFKFWRRMIVEKNSDDIIKKLHMLVVDPNQEVRQLASEASKLLLHKYSKLSKAFTADLDKKILQKIEKLELSEDDIDENNNPNIKGMSYPSKKREIQASEHLYKPRKNTTPQEDDFHILKDETQRSKSFKFNKTNSSLFSGKNAEKNTCETKFKGENSDTECTESEIRKSTKDSKIPLKTVKLDSNINDDIKENFPKCSQSVRQKNVKDAPSLKKEVDFKPLNDRLIRFETVSRPKLKKRSSSVQGHAKNISLLYENSSKYYVKEDLPPPKLMKTNDSVASKSLRRLTSPQSSYYSPPIINRYLNNLKFNEGCEEEFLKEVEKLSVKRFNINIVTYIGRIIPGLVYCLSKSDPIISEKSQRLILRLIPSFQREFEPSLSDILELIFSNTPIHSKSLDETTNGILEAIQKHYNPNMLISKVINEKLISSQHLVRFLLPLIQKDSVSLSRTDLCLSLLRISLQQMKRDRETVVGIISVISQKNKNSIEVFKAEEEDVSLVKRLEEIQNEEKYIDIIPMVDRENLEKSTQDILNFIDGCSTMVWDSIKCLVCRRIIQAINLLPDCDNIFGLIQIVLERKEYDSLEVFLPELLRHRQSFRVSIPRVILDEICSKVEQTKYINCFIDILKSEDETNIENALKELEYLYQNRKLQFSKDTESVSIAAALLVSHECPKIRQRVVSLLATLMVLYGEKAMPSYKKLDEYSRRIIDFYVEKKQTDR